MLNVIKAEIYKYTHRPYFYIITLVVSAIILLCEILFSSSGLSKSYIISEACPMGMNFALVLIILFSLVFSEEYKYNSLKNFIASNVSKEKIYFAKIIIQMLIILFVGIIIIGVFLCGLLLLAPGPGYSNDALIRELIKIVASLPMLLAGLSLANLLIIGIKKEGIAIVIYIIILLLSADIIKLLSKTIWSKIMVLNDYFFNTQILIVNSIDVTNVEIIQAVLIGCINMIIFGILGALLFRRAEVK